MNRFLTPIIASISILLFIQHGNLCFGYVSTRSPCNFRHSQHTRLMAEPPSTPSIPETSTEDETKVTPTRLSKRKRLSSLVRRLRLRLSSFLNRTHIMQPSVQIETEETPSNNETMQLEEVKEQVIAPSLDEIITNSRQSKAANNVDLSGSWKPIVTEEFKKEYDSFLANCSQSFMFRKVVVNGIGYQTEIIRQLNNGVDLEIIATNPAGNWNRTLVASDELQPLNATITDPDGDRVQVEAWWEENGTKHKSLLRGKPRVQGGVFETVRYLESDNVLVCESGFHPTPSSMKFKYGFVSWRFQRDK